MSGFDFANALDNFNGTTESFETTSSLNLETSTPSSVIETSTGSIRTSTPVPSSTKPASNVLCPRLGMKSGWYDERLVVSSGLRSAGDLVEISCKEGSTLRGPTHLLCKENGIWNGTQPHCEGINEVGLPMSTVLFISVLSGCCALILLVITVLLCKFVCCTKKSKDNSSSDTATTDLSDQESHDPYYAVHVIDRNRQSDTGSVHYAKPEVFSSFVHPSFYEDVYARWRSREELSERVYDSPWLVNRNLADQCQNPELKWSTTSLAAHNNYDYGRFGRIPRSQITDETDTESVNEALTTF